MGDLKVASERIFGHPGTPEYYLEEIKRLRERHALLCENKLWAQVHATSQKISLMWEGYHQALESYGSYTDRIKNV